jgi:hypothetical protein
MPLEKKVKIHRIMSGFRTHLFIHIPDILGLDVVLLDGVAQEVEIVVDRGAVQGAGAAFLE